MKNKIKISEIPLTGHYEGYLWRSNEHMPEIIQGDTLPAWPAEDENPFIIEGNLFDRNSRVSYFIRYIDGEYLVHRFDLSKAPGNYIKKRFLTSYKSMDVLHFREYWEPKADELCNDFEVLKPTSVVFVGFKVMEE